MARKGARPYMCDAEEVGGIVPLGGSLGVRNSSLLEQWVYIKGKCRAYEASWLLSPYVSIEGLEFCYQYKANQVNMTRRVRRSQKQKRGGAASSQSLVPRPSRPLIPSSAKRVERTMLRFSGSGVTNATTSGYSYYRIDSNVWTSSSPWSQLSALYMFVRPLYVRATLTAARSTGTADNPVVAFVPTPDGSAVGSAAMNLNTFEAPAGRTHTLGPGQEVSYTYEPYIAQTAYASAVASGYFPLRCPRLSLNSLPLVYYGDILVLTPGVNLVTSANYIQFKLEFVFEFDTLDTLNVQ